jgi:hypothetical protein
MQGFLEELMKNAVTYTRDAGRVTITAMDVVYALKRVGTSLTGLGGSIGLPTPTSTTSNVAAVSSSLSSLSLASSSSPSSTLTLEAFQQPTAFTASIMEPTAVLLDNIIDEPHVENNRFGDVARKLWNDTLLAMGGELARLKAAIDDVLSTAAPELAAAQTHDLFKYMQPLETSLLERIGAFQGALDNSGGVVSVDEARRQLIDELDAYDKLLDEDFFEAVDKNNGFIHVNVRQQGKTAIEAIRVELASAKDNTVSYSI